ncbi:putative bifunctional chitinase/lysozyme [Acanthocystis turfacea Chlorella virus Can0610SP]|nr:putative bifunctional chitinase/lysozyme [Acanthocystis turfacea Chlorella virus Can0610SP]
MVKFPKSNVCNEYMATVKDTKLEVSVKKNTDWQSGYDGLFVFKNDNAYDVLNWTLEYDFPENEAFTWFSEGDLVRKGIHVVMTPKDWNHVIKAGETKTIGFGGTKSLPTNLRFNQILPMVGSDPSLAKRGAWGPKVFAPYIDACAFPTPNLMEYYAKCGQKFFTLAFIVANGSNKAAWGGTIELQTQYLLDQIRQIRSVGGDVSVSFGGANGTELADVITDVDALVAEYSRVIDLYSLNRIDFDIEGGAVDNAKGVDIRNKAIALLNKKYPKLQITYCLPVLPIGLTLAGENLVRNARKNGAVIESFNGMSMDFGDSAAPEPEGRMGAYVIASCENLRSQVLSAGYSNPKIGTIPMIGVNDVQSEVFRITDAKKVYIFVQTTPWMSYAGFWSVNRDRPGKGTGANPFDSGIDQMPYDFTNTFQGKIVKELAPTSVKNPAPIVLQPNPSPLPPVIPTFPPSDPVPPPVPVPNISVVGKVVNVVSANRLKISYKKPSGVVATHLVTQKKHGCVADDSVTITLKGVKPYEFVKLEKTVGVPAKASTARGNANDMWDSVTKDFLSGVKAGGDPDDVIHELQKKYTGLGPANQQRLKTLA